LAGPPTTWEVPRITTLHDLARFLKVDAAHLDWFADCRLRLRTSDREPLRHYRYRWIAKRSGSLRLIESPKPRLKRIQRQILDEILAKIPVHESAHGFITGRSVETFVAPHSGRKIVLKMDLRDFFPAITTARVAAIFLTAGYPEDVAARLAGLCTNVTPPGVLREAVKNRPTRSPEEWRSRKHLSQPHLPQGAPSSPTLANLCAFRLDARLSALARASSAVYTRYADDLVFSGDDEFARSAHRFAIHVAAVVREEGFAIQHRKTRLMRRGVRQKVAGVVVNTRPNVTRDEFDALKAILHNCERHGPDGQNRDRVPDFRAHLLGRIAHVGRFNPERGARLKTAFDRIAW
jgi:hypothetical protein